MKYQYLVLLLGYTPRQSGSFGQPGIEYKTKPGIGDVCLEIHTTTEHDVVIFLIYIPVFYHTMNLVRLVINPMEMGFYAHWLVPNIVNGKHRATGENSYTP